VIGTDRTGKFQLIPVGKLRPAALAVRAVPAPEELESLTASVKRHGVLQPILARPAGGGFEVICGVRRWMAAKRAGLGTVPALVREMDDREALEILLAENRDRKPLGAEDRRRAMEHLRRLFPARPQKELDSWLGAPESAAPEPTAWGESETRWEPDLPAWMDEAAEPVATPPPPEPEATEESRKYWLEELAEKAEPIPESEGSRVRRRLLPMVRQFLEHFTRTGTLEGSRLDAVIEGLMASLLKDPPHLFLDLTYREPPRKYLPRHCLNVAKLGLHLGLASGLKHDELRELAVCGLLHDVGMFQIDESVFKKRTSLTDDEWAKVRSHPREGSILLAKEALLREVVSRVAYEHHERADGTGYPEGKKKEEIHVYARIINIVDTYEAMVSPRVHRLPVLPHEGMKVIMDEGASGMLDWDLVELFAKCMSLYPVGSYLRFYTGEVAVVVRPSPETATLPVVRIVADASRQMLRKPVLVDLSLQDPPLQFEAIARPM
jgi:HD-GYP domain-containing protein (c-di-GMP phosphodiesterase class II)